jgi:hypothetical protein
MAGAFFTDSKFDSIVLIRGAGAATIIRAPSNTYGVYQYNLSPEIIIEDLSIFGGEYGILVAATKLVLRGGIKITGEAGTVALINVAESGQVVLEPDVRLTLGGTTQVGLSAWAQGIINIGAESIHFDTPCYRILLRLLF